MNCLHVFISHDDSSDAPHCLAFGGSFLHCTCVACTAQARVQGEEWWVADMQIPYEAAAVNFVVNYFEHYDNNDRQDYKLKVGS